MKVFKKIILINKLFDNSVLIFRFYKLINIFICLNLISITGCKNLNKKENIDICAYAKSPCLLSTEHVVLITNKGKIKLKLYGKLSPLTVGNFVDFVDKGAYDNTRFNQVIKKPYPFIVRGGYDSLVKNNHNFIDNKTGKIRYIPLEIKIKSDKYPIYGKEIDSAEKINDIELKHKRASLSMARSKELNSASSQFFISLKSLPELDGRYAVFGKVIEGMNVVDIIEEKDIIIKALRL